MFDPEDRERAEAWVLALAESDPRVVAGAVVGSRADGPGDRWSDLDLTFAVATSSDVAAVLADWTGRLERELGAVRLFDLESGASVYRVFLLPGCLQLDVSFTPAAAFGARTPRFRLLFGDAGRPAFAPPPDPRELFGYAVHHALRARFALERGRPWLAEHWLSSLRDHGLELACLRRGLPAREGRGYDDLPDDVLRRFEPALPRSLTSPELQRALGSAIEALLAEAGEAGELVTQAEPALRELSRAP